jgi:hypothetical protein
LNSFGIFLVEPQRVMFKRVARKCILFLSLDKFNRSAFSIHPAFC